MTLGDALLSGRSINLNHLRFALAACVIISHAWPLALGAAATEPFEDTTGRSLGGWAVGVFFFMSGLLITASAERKRTIPFWRARVRRIVPGLGVALLVTLALAITSGATASFPQAATWFARAITLISIEHRLPEAFADNPYPLVVNGPLWSLFYEVAAYMICWAVVRVGGLRSVTSLAGFAAGAAALGFVHDALPGRLATFAPLMAAFALGMVAHRYRHQIAISPVLGCGILAVAMILPSHVAMGFAGLGLLIVSLCIPAFRSQQDVSFGLYIYGWPVAQTVVALVPGLSPVELALLTLVFTYPMAVLSWHLIERPALHMRRAVA